MFCFEVTQDVWYDLVVHAPVWGVLIMLTSGILVGVTAVMIVYKLRRKIYTEDGRCCPSCVICCITCYGACRSRRHKSKRRNLSSLALIESSTTVNSKSELLGSVASSFTFEEESMIDGVFGDEDEKVPFVKRKLDLDKCTEVDYGSDTESSVFLGKARLTSGSRGKPLAFSDLLCLSTVEKGLSQLYTEDKKAYSRLEYSFIDERAEMFYLMVQDVSQHLVAAHVVKEQWGEDMMSFSKEAFSKAKKRCQSVCTASMEKNEMKIPDTLQINLSSVSAHIIDHMNKSLDSLCMEDESEISRIMSEFQNNWARFEVLQSETNLKQVKQLEKVMKLKKQVLVTLYEEKTQLNDHLLEHKEKQIKELDRIQYESRSYQMDKQYRMVSEIEDTWESTLNVFNIELQREGQGLSLQLQKQLETEDQQGERSLQRNINQKEMALKNGNIVMLDYVTEYCDFKRVYHKGRSTREMLELQLVGSQYSSLIEHTGVKTLKSALHTEKIVYNDFLQRSNWIAPEISRIIKGNIGRVKDLKASLKQLRGKQRAKLQALIAPKAEGTLSEAFCRKDVSQQLASMNKVIEMQADLCDTECHQVVDQCSGRLKTFEVQLELSKTRQERRLEELLTVTKAHMTQTLWNDTNGIPATNEAVVMANMKFQKETKMLSTSYKDACDALTSKLKEETKSTLLEEHFVFQKQIEKLRRKQERLASLANKQEMALNALKSKLLDKLSVSNDKEVGDRIIQQHQANKEILTQNISKTKDYQNQVLVQKLQARKLEKKQEKEIELKQQEQPPPQPYRLGSAKRFVATSLVGWLQSVRHQREMESLENELKTDERKVKANLTRKFHRNATLQLQVHETEVIVKLASALNMTHIELENELKRSVSGLEQKSEIDRESCSMVTKSVLDLLSNAY